MVRASATGSQKPKRLSGRRLRSFRGELTPEQTADGMNAARRNAGRLVRDAKVMLDAGSFATATALSILGIEESDKV